VGGGARVQIACPRRNLIVTPVEFMVHEIPDDHGPRGEHEHCPHAAVCAPAPWPAGCAWFQSGAASAAAAINTGNTAKTKPATHAGPGGASSARQARAIEQRGQNCAADQAMLTRRR